MLTYDFDTSPNRRGTASIKWDFRRQDGDLALRQDTRAPTDPQAPIPLWVADMDFPPAEPITAALRARLDGVLGYTKPTPAYFDTIAAWVSRRHGWQVNPEWILNTIGTLPTINVAIQTFTEPGDHVIVQPPVFFPIPNGVTHNGRIASHNTLRYENGRYHIDFADLAARAAHPRCRALILCHPHNPVGRVWTREELTQLGQICADHDLLIISDELHSDLTYGWSDFASMGAISPDLHRRLIICSGPSKAFNLPGLKAAYAIIPSPDLRGQIRHSLQALDLVFSVDALSTLALQTAYSEGEPWLDQLLAYLAGNVATVRDYLAAHLPAVRLVEPDGLYLLWLDCRRLGLPPAELERRFVEEARVLVEMGHSYGQPGADFVRLNIGCPRYLLHTALSRLGPALAPR